MNMDLSADQVEIILERHHAYEMGIMEGYSLEELKEFLSYDGPL